LGLWEKPKLEIVKMHFAFRCDKKDILDQSISFLKQRNLGITGFSVDIDLVHH
jgi:hypothetical protein